MEKSIKTNRKNSQNCNVLKENCKSMKGVSVTNLEVIIKRRQNDIQAFRMKH